jgi:hypothetical protein
MVTWLQVVTWCTRADKTGPGVSFCTGGIRIEHTSLNHANGRTSLGLNLHQHHTATLIIIPLESGFKQGKTI